MTGASRFRALVVTSLMLASVAACDSGKGKVAFVGGNLWNGTGIPPILDAVIIVSNGVIEAAGPPDVVKIPRKAEVWRVDGRWLIPGLLDAHAHVERWMLPALLSHGITGVRDAGGEHDSILALRDEINLGATLGPRLFVSGAALDRSPARGPAEGLSNTSEARRAIDQRVLVEVSQVMLSPGITPALLTPLLDEADSFLLPVAAHLGKIDAITAANVGIDAIEHLSGIVEATVSSPNRYFRAHDHFYRGWGAALQGWSGLDSAALDRMARLLADSGVAMVPTLHNLEALAHLRDRAFIDSLDLSTVPAAVRQGWDTARLARDAQWTSRSFAAMRRGRPMQDLFLRRFLAAGGLLAAGSNAPFPLIAPGPSLHDELELLVAAGLSTKDALLSVTRNVARLLDAPAIGTVEPGKSADFLILRGNPLEDISNIRAIEQIVYKGVRYYPEDFGRNP
ncbi:MAG: amidohydrolase family protein [Gemmatimonadetes bacterium]|nr:amidohydrolase family protein [Gemmatimonadota bacterium]